MRVATGSNQYRTRPAGPASTFGDSDLVDQATQVMRCGEIWGTRCKVRVYPPEYAHANNAMRHPRSEHVMMQAHLSGRLPTIQRERLAWAVINADTVSVALSVCSIRRLRPSWFTDVYDKISNDPGSRSSGGIERILAEHPDCPPDLLHKLAASSAYSTRWAVIRNPQVSPDTVVLLVNDPDPDVRRLARGHPRLPDNYRMLLRISE